MLSRKVTPAASTRERNAAIKLAVAAEAAKQRALWSPAAPDMVDATLNAPEPVDYRQATSRDRPEDVWSRALAAAIATVPASWGRSTAKEPSDPVYDAAMHAWRCVMDDAARGAGRVVGDVLLGQDVRRAQYRPDAAMVWPLKQRATYTVLRWRVLDWCQAEAKWRDALAGVDTDDDAGDDVDALDMVAATLGDDEPKPFRRHHPAVAHQVASDMAGMLGYAERSPVWTLFYATLRDEDAAGIAGELQSTPEAVWQHLSRARKLLGADLPPAERRAAAIALWQALTDESRQGKSARKGHATDGYGYQARRDWERRARARTEPDRRQEEPTAERVTEDDWHRRAHRMHPDRRTEARIRRAYSIDRPHTFRPMPAPFTLDDAGNWRRHAGTGALSAKLIECHRDADGRPYQPAPIMRPTAEPIGCAAIGCNGGDDCHHWQPSRPASKVNADPRPAPCGDAVSIRLAISAAVDAATNHHQEDDHR